MLSTMSGNRTVKFFLSSDHKYTSEMVPAGKRMVSNHSTRRQISAVLLAPPSVPQMHHSVAEPVLYSTSKMMNWANSTMKRRDNRFVPSGLV